MHVLDEQAHQLLPLCPVELIDDAADLLSEVADPASEQIAVSQRGPLGIQCTAFGGQLVVAGHDLG